MLNPYEPSGERSAPGQKRKSTQRYGILALLLLFVALMAAFPGLRLLNQHYGWFPTNASFYGFEVNGQPVSLQTVAWTFIGTGSVFLLPSIACFWIAVRNRRHNRRLHSLER